MSGSILKRHAVGESVHLLGTLYDARRDIFLHQSLFENKAPHGAVELTPAQTTTSIIKTPTSFQERCDMLEIGPELGASIMSGLCDTGGHWERFLVGQTQGPVLRHTTTTCVEELNLMAKSIKKALCRKGLHASATHVLTGISWGADLVIRAKHPTETLGDENQLAESATAALTSLANPQTTAAPDEHTGFRHLDITVHGDTSIWLREPDSTNAIFTFEQAHKFIHRVSAKFGEGDNRSGTPIQYTLMPVSFLSMMRLMDIPRDVLIPESAGPAMAGIFKAFDELFTTHREMEEYLARCQHHDGATPKGHLALATARPRLLIRSRGGLKAKLAHALFNVRLQKGQGDQALQNLLDSYIESDISAAALKRPLVYSDKFDFLDTLDTRKVKYIGRYGPRLCNIVQDNSDKDIFVLHYSDIANKAHPEEWIKNRELLDELVRYAGPTKLVVIEDTDLAGEPLDRSYIAHFRHGQVHVEDMLEHRRILSVNCVMRCPEAAIDSANRGKPLNRCPVKIPCPNLTCDAGFRCNWICAVCCSPVEYAHVEDRLYCDCGESTYHKWEFQCRDANHGPEWVRYDPQDLETRLKELEPSEQLNVLILGETGVGKSTWINAFVNYLTHDTLDDALDAEELKWVIPSSFSTQHKDDSDSQGRFVQRDIKIGSNKDERNGANGQSATQRTCVYTVGIGNTRVRLIDTPGIGDTRGLDQDNKNMADILAVLRMYDNLHGIVILLKPNAARLTVMFRFCIKQLLTHLHKNAAHNIVFGFTNTRGSNYRPGDTFKPLETLLSEYTAIQLGLYSRNVFCFDSESFRYLAARKQGVEIGSVHDNACSWEYSVTESKRLVTYFQGLTPHSVRSTINLNETRDIIIRLTEPMALIAQKIQTSIAVNNDQIATLETTQLSRVQLEKSLYVQRESVESYEVGLPRTVCTHHDCVEVRSDLEGRDEKVVVYKTMCHRPCYLGATVKRNEKGHPDLEQCAAMGIGGLCVVCSHHFMDHMHIYYDYKSVTHQHKDEAVNKTLLKNASDIELQQEAIQMRKTAIEEFQIEYKQVQNAAIHFGFFLKRHAIEPYNDATVEYVDHLIHQERMKIKNGGRTDELGRLEKYKSEHLERVAILTKAMESGNTTQMLDDLGVTQLVTGLYGLPHFGADLKRIVENNERVVDAAFREKTCNVSAGVNWTKGNKGKKVRTVKLQVAPGVVASPSKVNVEEPGSSGAQPSKDAETAAGVPTHPGPQEGRKGVLSRLKDRIFNVLGA